MQWRAEVSRLMVPEVACGSGTTRRVMSDNGSGYVSSMRSPRVGPCGANVPVGGAVARGVYRGCRSRRFRAGSFRLPARSSQEWRAQLRPYVRSYNRQQPHASLGYQAPWSRLTSAE